VRATGDSLTNLVANLGTGRDKRSHNHFGFQFVSQFELEAAYQSNWIARQIVDVPNEDACREWRVFNGAEAKEIANEEKRLGLQQLYQNASCWSDLYGGAGIIMITDQDLAKPLNVDKIKKGSLKKLLVLDRWDLQPQEFNYSDPLADNWMLPEWYTFVNGQTRVHHSHIVRLEGARLPRRLSQIENGWGDSRLRRAMDDLRDAVATKGGIASLVLEANVDVITRQGLSVGLASPECDAITKRYQMFGMMKSIVNLALLDSNETLDRKSLSFAGLSQIMEQFIVWVSGAAQIPVTKLFGQSASGLSATGEGDLNNYYDSIKARQEGPNRRHLETIDQVLVRSAVGSFPEDLEFEWKPLFQASGLEQAQQDLADAQTDAMNIENGIIRPSHAMKRAQARGTYDITDEQIEAQVELEKDIDNGEFDNEGNDLPSFGLNGEESGAPVETQGKAEES
jgi:phage-related protein (TIGR01555 family)